MKTAKRRFLHAFAAVTLALALVRLLLPGVARPAAVPSAAPTAAPAVPRVAPAPHPRWSGPKHPVMSVPSYSRAFPDSNALQLTAARRWGVPPVSSRAEAEARKPQLVFVAASPYCHVAPLHSSTPYLVPRAALLLHDLGQAFLDSLYLKGIPLHLPVVTSVLRTQADVARLRTHNGNATERSCHLYATTFDVSYNRYHPVGRQVRNDTLRYVLSEVLRDLRQQQRCYVKYEKKQGCYHITVR